MAQREQQEPKSPLWLPALGAAFFVLAATAWAISGPFTRADVSPDAGLRAASAPASDGGADAPPTER